MHPPYSPDFVSFRLVSLLFYFKFHIFKVFQHWLEFRRFRYRLQLVVFWMLTITEASFFFCNLQSVCLSAGLLLLLFFILRKVMFLFSNHPRNSITRNVSISHLTICFNY